MTSTSTPRQELALTPPCTLTTQQLNPTTTLLHAVLIPVHLFGGILLPGQSIGNRIGGFCAELDLSSASAPSRCSSVSSSLSIAKDTPIALLSYSLGQLLGLGFVPSLVCRLALRSGTRGASFAVSNVRGPPGPLHYGGRKVETVAGFLPPPPGCPIGVVVQSYDGRISITCNADARAVPDADKFLGFVLDEFYNIAKEAGVVA